MERGRPLLCVFFEADRDGTRALLAEELLRAFCDRQQAHDALPGLDYAAFPLWQLYAERLREAAHDTTIMRERPHPQQAYRACLGILRLSKSYGTTRLEAACRRALTLGSHRYRSVASILERCLDQQPLATDTEPAAAPLAHDNIRGPAYYH